MKVKAITINSVIRFCILTLLVVAGGGVTRRRQQAGDSAPHPGSISGQITIEGRPVAGVDISLFDGDYPYGKPIATERSDAGGRYLFADVSSGHYCLNVDSPELVDAARAPYESGGWKVSVSNGQAVDHIDLALVRGGVISGRVLNLDGGPVANERVELIPADSGLPQRALYLRGGPITTDSNGNFKLTSVPPGRYLVSVGLDVARLSGEIWNRDDLDGGGRVVGNQYYAQTFYPGATERELAQAITVEAGGAVRGIQWTVGLRYPAYKVSGRVIDTRTGQAIPNCGLQVMQRVNNGYRGATVDMLHQDKADENGNFTIAGLIPGRFFIGAAFSEDNSNLYGRRLDFEIREADITGLVLKVDHGVMLEGKVVIDEADKGLVRPAVQDTLSQVKLSIRLAEIGLVDSNRDAPVASDGSFHIGGLREGEAYLDLYPGSPGHFSIIRIEFPNPDNDKQLLVYPAKDWLCRLQLGHTDIKGARVILAYKSGSLKGHVTITGSLPVGMRLHAWVSPQGALPPVDANGDFTLEGLKPGEYEVQIGDRYRRFTESKKVRVEKNGQATVSFVLDANHLVQR